MEQESGCQKGWKTRGQDENGEEARLPEGRNQGNWLSRRQVRLNGIENTLFENERITAFGNLQEDLILGTHGFVVFRQLAAQTSNLNPDTGIRLRVEVRRAAQDLGGNLILLQVADGFQQRVLGQIAQKFGKSLGTVKKWAIGNTLDLG